MGSGRGRVAMTKSGPDGTRFVFTGGNGGNEAQARPHSRYNPPLPLAQVGMSGVKP